MLLVTMLIVVVVECSSLKPYLFPCTGYSIKSFNGSSSVSFAMRERSAIGLRLLDSSMGFPGLCRGITQPDVRDFCTVYRKVYGVSKMSKCYGA